MIFDFQNVRQFNCLQNQNYPSNTNDLAIIQIRFNPQIGLGFFPNNFFEEKSHLPFTSNFTYTCITADLTQACTVCR